MKKNCNAILIFLPPLSETLVKNTTETGIGRVNKRQRFFSFLARKKFKPKLFKPKLEKNISIRKENF